ncbi:MAG: hypothetical protein ACE5KE_00360 [Methanosarcinales archaeon]
MKEEEIEILLFGKTGEQAVKELKERLGEKDFKKYNKLVKKFTETAREIALSDLGLIDKIAIFTSIYSSFLASCDKSIRPVVLEALQEATKKNDELLRLRGK